MRIFPIPVCAFAAVTCLLGSILAIGQATTLTSVKVFPEVADQANLHNAHVVTSKIISGAQPEGPESFKALKALGVKTIISVDGATPDVDMAKAYGMKYVHIPVTYGTITGEQSMQLAKAFKDLDGPIYVHCHHGKHRSAAAVAVACVMSGELKPEQAESVLKTFGTGANYTGLWKVARDARPVDPKAIADLKAQFPEAVKPTGIQDAMVAIDHHTDNLKAVQSSGWRAPADHPDLDPAHEAVQLQEHLREMSRTDAVRAKPEKFRTMLTESEQASTALQALLAVKPVVSATADATFKRVTASCTSCHAAYRD